MTGQAAKSETKKRAPGLYIIGVGKLLKGLILLLVALSVFSLSDKNLPDEFHRLLLWLHEDPEKLFFTDLADKIRAITPAGMRQVAWGSLLYSSLVSLEGLGLLFRQSWAGWLSIGESAFFIPIEVRHMVHRFSYTVVVVLVINIVIVWYLYLNRERLFKHHAGHSNEGG